MKGLLILDASVRDNLSPIILSTASNLFSNGLKCPRHWSDNIDVKRHPHLSALFTIIAMLFGLGCTLKDNTISGTLGSQPSEPPPAETPTSKFPKTETLYSLGQSISGSGPVQSKVKNVNVLSDNTTLYFLWQKDDINFRLMRTTVAGGTPADITPIGLSNVLHYFIAPNESKIAIVAEHSTDNGPVVYMIDPDGSNTIQLSENVIGTANGAVDSEAVYMFTPNSLKFIYLGEFTVDTHNQLYAINVDGTGRTLLNTGATNGVIRQMVVTGDNNYVIYLGSHDTSRYEVYSAEIDGAPHIRLNQVAYGAFDGLWSTTEPNLFLGSNGQTVYYAAEELNNVQVIYKVEPNGTGHGYLNAGFATDQGMLDDDESKWTVLDGKVFVFGDFVSVNGDGHNELYSFDEDGTNGQQITDSISNGFNELDVLEIDSINNKVVFNDYDGTNVSFDLHIANYNGSGKLQISPNPLTSDSGQKASHAKFSPDGSKIAFVADLNYQGLAQTWVVDPNGSNLTLLSGTEWGSIQDPEPYLEWSQDGTRVYFKSFYDPIFLTTTYHTNNLAGSDLKLLFSDLKSQTAANKIFQVDTSDNTGDILKVTDLDLSNPVDLNSGGNYKTQSLNAIYNCEAQNLIVIFGSMERSELDIYVTDYKGQNIVKINPQVSGTSPAVTSEGITSDCKKIYYHMGYDLYEYDVENSTNTKIYTASDLISNANLMGNDSAIVLRVPGNFLGSSLYSINFKNLFVNTSSWLGMIDQPRDSLWMNVRWSTITSTIYEGFAANVLTGELRHYTTDAASGSVQDKFTIENGKKIVYTYDNINGSHEVITYDLASNTNTKLHRDLIAGERVTELLTTSTHSFFVAEIDDPAKEELYANLNDGSDFKKLSPTPAAFADVDEIFDIGSPTKIIYEMDQEVSGQYTNYLVDFETGESTKVFGPMSFGFTIRNAWLTKDESKVFIYGDLYDSITRDVAVFDTISEQMTKLSPDGLSYLEDVDNIFYDKLNSRLYFFADEDRNGDSEIYIYSDDTSKSKIIQPTGIGIIENPYLNENGTYLIFEANQKAYTIEVPQL